MDPHTDCPRIEFCVKGGELYYRTVTWYERAGINDAHIEGRSHFVYGPYKPVKTIGLKGGSPADVLDRLLEMATKGL